MDAIKITTPWAVLSEAEQLGQWRAFMVGLDRGDAGYHPYYGVLAPLWERGDVPEIINDEQLEAYEAQMRAEGMEMSAADLWFDHGVLAADPAEAEFWGRFDPAAADGILGCPPF